jgi:hypothetical protein
VGVRYEARNAPTQKVLFFLPQSYSAFRNKAYKHHTTSNRNTLSPGLTGFGHRSPCLRRQGSPPSVRTTIGRRHLQGTQQSRRIPEWLIDEAGLAHRQLIHILQHRRRKCQEAQTSDFYRWLQAHPPHTHLARFVPNQHTLTCRSINDLVSKRPACPQTGDILGS